jgi:hypothetical protein
LLDSIHASTPAFSFVCATAFVWTLVAVFAMALRHKLGGYAGFRGVLAQYRILPQALVDPAAAAVVVAEAGVIVLLLVDVGAGAWFAMLVLALYTGAIAINLFRGRRSIDCGCGGAPTPLSVSLVLRNAMLMAMAAWLGLKQPAIATVAGAWWVAGAATIALVLCYQIVNQLLANRIVPAHRGLAAEAGGG